MSLFPSDAVKFSLTMDDTMCVRIELRFHKAEKFLTAGQFCLYAVTRINNKVNQQNIIRKYIRYIIRKYIRLNLVPRINAATSLGALCLISGVPLKSGSAKGQIFHCAC